MQWKCKKSIFAFHFGKALVAQLDRDGIDGLAAVTGIIVNSTFAALFIYLKQYELAAISFAMVGAIAGFLRYNITPAKIFMGDTGALLIGLISAVMAVKFIEVSKITHAGIPVINCVPALTIAILIGPVFDTLRVFTLRIASGKSPFEADRNHIHYRILGLGLNHLQTTICLSAINLLSIGLVFVFSGLSNSLLIVLIMSVSIISNWIITFSLRSKEREHVTLRNFLA